MISVKIHIPIYYCKRRDLEHKLETVQDRKSGRTSEKHLEKCFEIQRELKFWEYSDYPDSWPPLVNTAWSAVPFPVLFAGDFSFWEMNSISAETTSPVEKRGGLTNGKKATVP